MINQTKSGTHVIYYQQQLNKHTTTWNLSTFSFPTLATRRKNIFLYFFTKLKTYNRCFFYLQKMESVWEIEAPHTALNSGLIWRWDEKIHNYTVTYYSWADVLFEIWTRQKKLLNGQLTEVQSLL